jgi:hypothetical protein
MSWHDPIIFALGFAKCKKDLYKVIREKEQLSKLYLDTKLELDRVMWNLSQENKRKSKEG